MLTTHAPVHSSPDRTGGGGPPLLAVLAAVVAVGLVLELAVLAAGLSLRPGHHLHTGPLAVTLGDRAVEVGSAPVTAGLFDLTVGNQGTRPDGLMVFRTDLAPGDLPVTSDGQIDETSEELTKVFDGGDAIDPGRTATFTLGLVAGSYVLVGNQAGDYARGMVAGLTVDEAAAATPVDSITLRDYSVASAVPSSWAGLLDFRVTNAGPAPHELLLVKTDLAANRLPLGPDGRVDEDALTLVVDSGDDLAAGDTKTFSAALEPGHYVLFCNLTDHYRRGMYLPFDVK